MVYGRYNELINGGFVMVYKPSYNWGAPVGCLLMSWTTVAPALVLRNAFWELKVLRKAMQTQQLDSGKIPERRSKFLKMIGNLQHFQHLAWAGK